MQVMKQRVDSGLSMVGWFQNDPCTPVCLFL